MRMTISTENGTKGEFLAGVITDVTKVDENKCILGINVKYYDREEKKETTKNFKVTYENGVEKLADYMMAEHSPVKEGAFIGTMISTDADGTVRGINYKIGSGSGSGKWNCFRISQREGSSTISMTPKTIIMGCCCNVQDNPTKTGKERLTLSVPVSAGRNEKNELVTEWNSIAFFGPYDEKSAHSPVKNAKAFLFPRTVKNDKGDESTVKRRAIILCGEKSAPYTAKSGRIYDNQYIASEFELIS